MQAVRAPEIDTGGVQHIRQQHTLRLSVAAEITLIVCRIQVGLRSQRGQLTSGEALLQNRLCVVLSPIGNVHLKAITGSIRLHGHIPACQKREYNQQTTQVFILCRCFYNRMPHFSAWDSRER